VLAETKKALQISQTDTITNRLPLCVEISLQTVEGDKMILEVWSLNLHTEQCDPTVRATYTVYSRMGILLKSLISVTRVLPSYKLSRRQSTDSYNIYYRIYVGEPQVHNLGKCHPILNYILWKIDWINEDVEKKVKAPYCGFVSLFFHLTFLIGWYKFCCSFQTHHTTVDPPHQNVVRSAKLVAFFHYYLP
jgi:Autophagy-related protein 13